MAGVDWSSLPAGRLLGEEMHQLMAELYPICRSLSGDGVRETFAILQREVPLELTEVPSGTQVFDWKLPREWNIRDAWIDAPDGTRVVDFKRSNLHVLGYSVPVRAQLAMSELREHLFTHPHNPDWVPFRTSYYTENWGFCLSQKQLEQMPDGEYDVVIDSSLTDGFITYAEAHLAGETADEILFSAYSCHPSLCNDNLSGVVLTATLCKYLGSMSLRHSYRFLLAPSTIGPLCWLWKNEDKLEQIVAGLAISCAGDSGAPTYKQSRRGDTTIDQAAANVVHTAGGTVIPFDPWGGNERQFCSPGFNLPVGVLTRSLHDAFPGYHSSADDLQLVRPEFLEDSFQRCLEIVDVLETNTNYVNLSPKGEPQLGRRGLYRKIAGGSSTEAALLWVLNFSDGEHSLLEISDRSGIPYPAVREAAETLKDHDLVTEADLTT
jgi:aminopeptidase-like protein